MVDAQRLRSLLFEAVHLQSAGLDGNERKLESEERDDRCVVESVDQVAVVVEERQLAGDAPCILAGQYAERLTVESPDDWRLLRSLDVALQVLCDLVG